MGIRQISVWVDEDVLVEAKKVAEAEGIKQAQVLRRWLRQKSGVDNQKINFESLPAVPSDFFDHLNKLKAAEESALGLADIKWMGEPENRRTAVAANRDAEVDVPKVSARIAGKINSARSEKNSIAPSQISMGVDISSGSDYGVETVTKDGEIVSEAYTGLSGTPVNMEPFRPKPIDEKRRLVLDAVATTGGKVTVASEIPAPEKKSDRCSECGAVLPYHQRGCGKRK